MVQQFERSPAHSFDPLQTDGLIVHEWIEKSGGAEKVLASIMNALPGFDVHCLWNGDPIQFSPPRVVESILAKTPLRERKKVVTSIAPIYWRTLRGARYEKMIISSHSFAHHARLIGNSDCLKYVYAHTPARYVWEPALDQRASKLPYAAAASLLRVIDRRAAKSADYIACNSKFVKGRIERAWDRTAEVIHPPVDSTTISAERDWRNRLTASDEDILSNLPDSFVLGASRLVLYKSLDKVIAAGEAVDTPVVIAGAGPDRSRLDEIAARADVPVYFLGRVSNEMLYALYQQALVYIFPPIEDFGIMPVEAMAAGAGVVANRIGGAAETVLEGLTGACVDFESPDSVVRGIESAAAVDAELARARSAEFATELFEHRIRDWLHSGEQVS